MEVRRMARRYRKERKDAAAFSPVKSEIGTTLSPRCCGLPTSGLGGFDRAQIVVASNPVAGYSWDNACESWFRQEFPPWLAAPGGTAAGAFE